MNAVMDALTAALTDAAEAAMAFNAPALGTLAFVILPDDAAACMTEPAIAANAPLLVRSTLTTFARVGAEVGVAVGVSVGTAVGADVGSAVG